MADEKKGFFGFIKGIGRTQNNYSEEEAQQRSYALAKSQEEEQQIASVVAAAAALSTDPQVTAIAEFAQAKLNELLHLANFSGNACLIESDHERISLEIKQADDPGRLIGKDGSTLESLQILIRTFIQKKFNQSMKIFIDIGDYKKRKNEQLLQQAKQAAKSVLEKNMAVDLRPMTASERRLIHTLFQDDPNIQTRSMGDGMSRHIVLEKKGAPTT